MKMPEKGIPRDELFRMMERSRAKDLRWRGGKSWGYIYDAGPEAEAVGDAAYAMFLSENALDPTVYPSLLRFENEVVAMAAAHLHGDDGVAGNFTSGGTESIMLAVKTARDFSRARRPEVHEPEMVLPVTAHAAFQKAAHYLDVKPVLVRVDEATFKADVEAVREALTPNTILLVGSAPSYAHGVIDPIEALGRLALERGLLLHVDGCIGGFLLPYFRRLGSPVPPFDFAVPGVTSISMDLHKYAYTPKGASVVLYRSRELRKHQIYSCARWTGYSVVNATVQSSKSGGPVAAAWAVLNSLGDSGYLELARLVRDATRRIVEGIEAIEGLRILGRPEMSLIAFTSEAVGVFHIADEMNARGWYVQPQLGFGGSRENIHLTVGPSNADQVEAFLSDLRASVEKAKEFGGPGRLAAMVKEAFASIDPAAFDSATFSQMLAMAGLKGVELPERRAEINEVLNALPPEVCERLLTEFVNELFTLR